MTSTKRSPALPDVPTVAESGFPGFEAVGWLGILVPNGTPPAVIARLNAEFGKVMQNPDVQKALIAQGVEATHEHARGVRRDDQERDGEVAKDHSRRRHQARVTREASVGPA